MSVFLLLEQGEKLKEFLMQDGANKEQIVQKVRPIIYFSILMMMILVQIAIDQYVPSLPAIAKAFHSTESSIQFTLFLFMLGLGCSHLFLVLYPIK